ncbi:MAG TPA: hypothetical protein VGR22_03610 [Thermomicrobiales bacterium]|nr:hypothetical protein [Thermomicrobiales bacterium]
METTTQIAIARRIDMIAEWRAEREHQDMLGLGPEAARRSRRSAEGLRELANHIAGLPDDHPHIVRLRELAFAGGQFDPGPMLLNELGRFRFHEPEQRVEVFLEKMVEYAEQDASEIALFGGPQVPGDNPWIIRIIDDEDDWDA